MIADTAMGLFKLAPRDPNWFQDRATVGRAVDAVLDTPLGLLVNYAGIIRHAKKAPDREAIHTLVATGNDDVFALQDAKRPTRMTIVLLIVHGALAVDARCYDEEMVRRDDDGDRRPEGLTNPASCCEDPAGASPVSVSGDAPSSRATTRSEREHG